MRRAGARCVVSLRETPVTPSHASPDGEMSGCRFGGEASNRDIIRPRRAGSARRAAAYSPVRVCTYPALASAVLPSSLATSISVGLTLRRLQLRSCTSQWWNGHRWAEFKRDVAPPSAQNSMWCRSQRDSGSSQPGHEQPRSRSRAARRMAVGQVRVVRPRSRSRRRRRGRRGSRRRRRRVGGRPPRRSGVRCGPTSPRRGRRRAGQRSASRRSGGARRRSRAGRCTQGCGGRAHRARRRGAGQGCVRRRGPCVGRARRPRAQQLRRSRGRVGRTPTPCRRTSRRWTGDGWRAGAARPPPAPHRTACEPGSPARRWRRLLAGGGRRLTRICSAGARCSTARSRSTPATMRAESWLIRPRCSASASTGASDSVRETNTRWDAS